jgi:drug/metabolite transporter (DMT)-like permease
LEKLKAHLALLGANLIYGINYTVAKDVMPEYIAPFGFIFLRVSGALILFWSLSFFTKWETIQKADLPRMIFAGIFGVAMNQMLFFQGLNLTNPINASIIMTTNPILVLVISAILIRERISVRKIIGIAIGLVGAVLLILFKGNSTAAELAVGTDTALGDFLVFLNATSYGIYLVIVKPLMKKYQPATVIKYVFTFGFCFVIPFGWGEFSRVEWSSFPLDIGMKAAFVVIGTTFFAYLFNIYALKRVSSTAVSIYIYSQPLFATLVALWLGSDTLTIVKVVATVLIFIGVYLVSVKRNAPKVEAVQNE